MRCANEDSDALVAAVTGSVNGSAALGPLGDKSRHRKPFEAAPQLLWGGVADVAHLDEGLGSGLAV